VHGKSWRNPLRSVEQPTMLRCVKDRMLILLDR
jgi:hypothetical protein